MSGTIDELGGEGQFKKIEEPVLFSNPSVVTKFTQNLKEIFGNQNCVNLT